MPLISPRRSRRQPGQALVLIALILPFLVLLLLTAVEIGSRIVQRSALEDALRQATRSAVQSFAYARLAENVAALQGDAGCSGSVGPGGGCAGNPVAETAAMVFERNLGRGDGLAPGETPATVARRVIWTVATPGGSCGAHSSSTPLVCAELDAPLAGLIGRFGSWTPHISAADTLDHFTHD